MGNDPTSRTLWVLAAIAVGVWIVQRVWDAILPFVIALLLAAVLDPLIDRLQRRGLPRGVAVALVFGVVMAGLAALIVFLVPTVLVQAAAFSQNLDRHVADIVRGVDDWLRQHEALLRRWRLPVTVSEGLQQYGGQVASVGQAVVRGVVGLIALAGSRVIWVVLIPLVTLYALADYDLFRQRALHLLPADHRDAVAELARRVAQVFVSYVRGLAIVCVCVGVATGLLLAGGFRLPYGLLLAVLAAALYAIPYIGELTVLALLGLAAAAAGHSGASIVGIVVAQLVLFQIFDQGITPRVVSSQVGIHPVTGLFALAAGGYLFGLVGMALAVPVAASLKVVAGHYYPRLVEPLETETRVYRQGALLPRRRIKVPQTAGEARDGGAAGEPPG